MIKHLIRCFLCCILTSGLVACFGSDRQPTAQAVPTDGYGIYDGCHASDAACLDHLQVFADGGFKLVLNYNVLTASSAAQIVTYADSAQVLGLKIIWAINDP